jgi:putative flippase GtrA
MALSDSQTRELQFISRFGLVGVANTGIDIGIFSFLFFVLDLPLLAANTTGYLVALTGSFLLNKNWTFAETKTQGRTGRQYLLFVGLGLGGLALSNIAVWSLTHLMPEFASKVASVVVVFAWNYVTSRMIVFRPGSHGSHKPTFPK